MKCLHPGAVAHFHSPSLIDPLASSVAWPLSPNLPSIRVRPAVWVQCSGKTVALRIYVQPKNSHKVDFAMQSLKRAMK